MPQEESGDGDGAAAGVASENAELVNAGENPNQVVYSIFLISSWHSAELYSRFSHQL